MTQPSIAINKPVRIYQGLEDNIAQPVFSRELMAKLASDDVHITLIKVALNFTSYKSVN